MDKTLTKVLESGLVLALLTGLLYIVTVGYSNGYYDYFGLAEITNYGFSVDTSVEALKAFLTILSFYFPLFTCLIWIIHYKLNIGPPFIFSAVVTAAAIAMLPFVYIYARSSFIYLLISIVLTGLPCFGILFISKEDRDTATKELDSEILDEMINVRKKNRGVNDFVFCVFVVLTIIMFTHIAITTSYGLSYKLGEKAAEKNDSYIVLQDEQKVLLYKDDIKYVFAPLDDNGNLQKEYYIYEITEISDMKLVPYTGKIGFSEQSIPSQTE